MTNILLLGKESASFADLAAELTKKKDFNVVQVGSGKETLTYVNENKIDVVVAAELLSDGFALPFVKELMKKHPHINCAMVSSLPPKEFHEVTEGLGLFMQLPINSGAEEANKMMQFLDSINSLMGQ